MNIFEFAISKELEGETFYRDMANSVPNRELRSIFGLLADQERGHRALLELLMHHATQEALDLPAPEIDVHAVFQTLISTYNFTSRDFNEADLYRFAHEAETESLKLYQNLAKSAESAQERAIFSRMAQEEQIHQGIIEGILHIQLLTQTQNQGSV